MSSIERIVSWIDLRSLDSRPMNLLTLVVKTCSPCSGGLFDDDVLFGKLAASCFTTLAPDGALTLLRNLLSEVKIGYVDSQQIMTQYEGFRIAQIELEKEQKRLEAEYLSLIHI